MAKYRVIERFRDLQDGEHIYEVGDKYPRNGRAKKERAEELSTKQNKLGKPLIEEVED